MKFQNILVYTVVIMTLFGCEKNSGQPIGTKSDDSKLREAYGRWARTRADLSTPDRALKSRWAMQDQEETIRCHLRGAMARISEPVTKMDAFKIDVSTWGFEKEIEFFTGTAEVAQRRDNRKYNNIEFDYCNNKMDRLSRTIESIKSESESRAIVFAKIRNISSIPSNSNPADFEIEERKTGVDVKYEFEKVGNSWKIEQIYTKSALLPEYGPQYEAEDKEFYPSMVMKY